MNGSLTLRDECLFFISNHQRENIWFCGAYTGRNLITAFLLRLQQLLFFLLPFGRFLMTLPRGWWRYMVRECPIRNIVFGSVLTTSGRREPWRYNDRLSMRGLIPACPCRSRANGESLTPGFLKLPKTCLKPNALPTDRHGRLYHRYLYPCDTCPGTAISG